MAQELIRDLQLVAPLVVLSLGALMVILVDVFARRPWPRAGATVGVLLLALLGCWQYQGLHVPAGTAFGGLIYTDPLALFFNALLLAGSIGAVLLGSRKLTQEGIESGGEYYGLLIISTLGAMLFANSAELITLFLGLETMSMALYCLCGSAPAVRRSSESALKYFLLGSFSSAFMLYGISLLYGLTGSTMLPEIAQSIGSADRTILVFALGLMLVGLVFKLGAVPFHFWAPDVYEGAPTPVTAYMACVIKASAVAATLRVLWSGFGDIVIFWSGAVWCIAVLTMVVGNIIAVRQRSLKRLLAYSSIAHAGYIMVAFLAPGDEFGGGAAILYYIVAYTIMTMGAFGVVLAVTSHNAQDPHADDLSRFNGLGWSRPVLGALMSVFMLSLAGIPPGLAGLLGKVYIFSAAVRAEYKGLAIIGVLCSAISVYYYLRVIVAMYFHESARDEHAERVAQSPLPLPLIGVMTACAAGIIILGIFPSIVHDGAVIIMQSL